MKRIDLEGVGDNDGFYEFTFHDSPKLIITPPQECALSPVFRDAMKFGIGAFMSTPEGIKHIPHGEIMKGDE